MKYKRFTDMRMLNDYLKNDAAPGETVILDENNNASLWSADKKCNIIKHGSQSD